MGDQRAGFEICTVVQEINNISAEFSGFKDCGRADEVGVFIALERWDGEVLKNPGFFSSPRGFLGGPLLTKLAGQRLTTTENRDHDNAIKI
jgi:hypothetical protein